MTKQEIAKFETWIIENVDETVVPADEGLAEGLIYNLIHLLRGDGKRFDYEKEQFEELESWGTVIEECTRCFGAPCSCEDCSRCGQKHDPWHTCWWKIWTRGDAEIWEIDVSAGMVLMPFEARRPDGTVLEEFSSKRDALRHYYRTLRSVFP